MLMLTSTAIAEVPERPAPYVFVNDFAGILPDTKELNLEKVLQKYKDSLSLEVIVITINSEENTDINEYASEILSTWAIPKRDDYSGIVIVIDYYKRETAIAGSKNISKSISGAIATRVIEQYMKPDFRKENYTDGVLGSLPILAGLSQGTLSIKDLKRSDHHIVLYLALFLLVFFVIIFPVTQFRRVKENHLGTKPLNNLKALVFLNSFGVSNKSGYDDFANGKGTFVSRSFGGFGGGGISGKW